ncbi:MAG: hypothetical protein GTN53_05925 [Candidatus Aminicenantes bacterium]|nr:hypothetical protein [Candidatus Aminicenantes bacterium]NIT22026.1 hypothetical protein [Candidatus Aminicenantes bacterium]
MFLKKKTMSFKLTATLLCLAFIGLYALLTTGCSTNMNGRGALDLTPDEPVNKYVMKQKVWTLGDKFVIKDETENPVFYVKGKVFSVGDKLSFRDTSGKELAYISQKVFSFRSLYRIYRGKELIAKIKKKITLFNDKYTVDVSGSDDYKVAGNFWDYEYTFTRNNRKVAFVSKKFFAWGDTYGIFIKPGEDDILILASAVVIDMVSHGDESHHFFTE